MNKNLYSFSAIALMLTASLLPITSSYAAKATFCDAYAREAVNQFKLNQQSNCGFTGSQWSANYTGQHDWCLTVRQAIAEQQSQQRMDKLASCIGESALVAQQPHLSNNTQTTSVVRSPFITRMLVNRYLNRIFNWLYEDEKRLAQQGRPLTPMESYVAEKIGVHNPENVRIVVLDKMPLPQSDALLRLLIKKFTNNKSSEVARALGYTIVFLDGYETHRPTLSANLKVVQMMEEEGRKAFLKRYLTESLVMGFGNSTVSEKKYAAYQQFGDDVYGE